jgi:hypothetical protein
LPKPAQWIDCPSDLDRSAVDALDEVTQRAGVAAMACQSPFSSSFPACVGTDGISGIAYHLRKHRSAFSTDDFAIALALLLASFVAQSAFIFAMSLC